MGCCGCCGAKSNNIKTETIESGQLAEQVLDEVPIEEEKQEFLSIARDLKAVEEKRELSAPRELEETEQEAEPLTFQEPPKSSEGEAAEGAVFKLNDSVTWTDASDEFVAMVMEDNDIARDAVGTVVGFVDDDVRVRFGSTEIELSRTALVKVPGSMPEVQQPQVQQPREPDRASAPVEQPKAEKQEVRMVTIELPPGATPGATIQAQAPTGEILQVQVPPGSRPGQQITLQY
mmetsp:Transcript_82430/g.146118  ORF Transcript_82430/g.146118 Transcript_82430/m.146118 type:complete len:233 (-) Transcript_82430:22-720(-)